jgi:hypothetical protein
MKDPIAFLGTLLSILSGFFLIVAGYLMENEYKNTYWNMTTLAGVMSMAASMLFLFTLH